MTSERSPQLRFSDSGLQHHNYQYHNWPRHQMMCIGGGTSGAGCGHGAGQAREARAGAGGGLGLGSEAVEGAERGAVVSVRRPALHDRGGVRGEETRPEAIVVRVLPTCRLGFPA